MRPIRHALALACFVAGFALVPSPIAAGAIGSTDRYVDPTGTDAGACAVLATPCKTINYAVSQSVGGDTIHVAAGTYPEMVVVDRSLTFVGANVGQSAGVGPASRGPESIVKGFRSPANTPGWPYPAADQEYSATIDGFTIDPQGDTTLLSASTFHLVSLFGGPDVKVQNNIFDGGPFDPACGYTCTTMTDSALNIQSGTFTVSGNLFTDFRTPIDISQHTAAHPIVAGTLSNNRFTHITNRAIWLYDDAAPGAWPGVTVAGNSFDAAGWVNPDWGPAAVVITTGGNHITGNTITHFSSGVFAQVCDGSNPGTSPNVYSGNHFLANRSGIQYYQVAASGCPDVHAEISGNDFVGNTAFGVRWNGTDGFTPPNDLDATCNWWGSAGGAGSSGADKATAHVDTDPWSIASGGPCTGGVTGYLRVTTSPALPSQITVDGNPADTWGLTWLKVGVGSHEVCFRDVAGYTTPACQTVAVTQGATSTVTGSFVARGYLRVTTSPPVASQISVDGVPRDNWGMWTDLPVGSHEVCFGAVADHLPPSCQTVNLTAGATTEVTGTFTSSPGAAGLSGVGYLRATTSPAVPSQISVDGTIADTWGLVWLEIAPGTHQVCFSAVEGYTGPSCQAVEVTAGEIATVTGTFVQRGFLKVELSPAVAGTITIGGVPVNDWGNYTDRPPGTYHVCFGAVPGLTAPACQDPVVTAGNTTTIVGTYT